MSDQQAYAGQGGLSSGTSEWNRMESAIRSVMDKMATMTLVKVVAVRGAVVDIQPIVAQMDGAGNAVDHGIIHNAPVWRYQAGAAAVIVDPVVGDIGMAVFAHSDISAAKSARKAAPPGSKRRFDWSDAVYLGGVLGAASPTTFVRLTAAGGVEITAPAGIKLNGPTTVTGGLTIDGKDFATHIHKGVTAGGGVSGPVGP